MRISDWSSDVCSSDLRKSSGKRVIRKTVLSVRSSLDASREQPANVEALEREEEQQHGDERDHRARHHQLDILDMLARQPGKRDRQRLLVGIVEDDQRPQKVAPAREEGDDRERDQDRKSTRLNSSH